MEKLKNKVLDKVANVNITHVNIFSQGVDTLDLSLSFTVLYRKNWCVATLIF